MDIVKARKPDWLRQNKKSYNSGFNDGKNLYDRLQISTAEITAASHILRLARDPNNENR
jgi:hypothetical protein